MLIMPSQDIKLDLWCGLQIIVQERGVYLMRIESNDYEFLMNLKKERK